MGKKTLSAKIKKVPREKSMIVISYLFSFFFQVVTLQTKFDYGKLLNHAFLKQTFGDLTTQINNVGDRVDAFQTKLADYFMTIAVHDRDLAMAELTAARDGYSEKEAQISETSKRVDDDLKVIFRLAFTLTGAEIAENAAELALQIANAFNPIKHLAEGAQIVLDIKAAAAKLALSGVQMAKLGRALVESMPKVEKIRARITKQKGEMEATVQVMEGILKKQGPLTEADAKNIIKRVGDFTESATPEDITEIGEVLQLLASTACDAIDAADTLAGAGVALVAAGKYQLLHLFGRSFSARF